MWYLFLCGGKTNANYLDFLPLLYNRLPLCILSAYFTLYFLIPRYLLRKKYRELLLVLVVLSILYPVLFYYYFLLTSNGDQMSVLLKLKVSLWDGLGLTMAVSGFATVIKLMKTYYVENSENERLQQQKTNHELQLLKSQLNSRFLFDALQSIQYHVRHQSPSSPGLVLKLSDLLSYILYENDELSVPLKKEIEMIEGYLKLEKECHGNRIDIQVTQQGKFDEKRIAPLVLLPLVESCFEHSSANQKKGSGVALNFNVIGLVLQFTFNINNLRSFSQEVFQKSLRIKNVKHRLNSYYRGRHELGITEENNNYTIQLEIGL